MNFKEFIAKLLGVKLPIWAYGLECGICQTTFISEQAHHEHAKKNRTIRQHKGKIPILKK